MARILQKSAQSEKRLDHVQAKDDGEPDEKVKGISEYISFIDKHKEENGVLFHCQIRTNRVSNLPC